ncbi:competence transcription factor [Listeria fleischmannii 1991]|uniref:Genetic competence transcription factor n=2 Tax=Listeria fleischmannii TaxID=1069827 RepID=A0A2X3H7G3_9LIST|nr:competence protein ComK [Listeria fleischmannii]EMG26891.1 competence transcription factor [Listeria fleischmannii subsp. fleischmannii LU2006-1]KMT58354.1 competence transcription factor [Listeria fleischmannii 1991]SQC68477.1 Genetic competence transcription factor [Listeria fleischmannii subsp. fleischmannii]
MENKKIEKQIYEVNPHTMIILPHVTGESLFSRVIEIGSDSISKFTPFELIKTSCKYFGANYEGRKEGTKHLIGITHKPPIIIDPMSYMYAFPTASPNNSNCVWVFPQHIKEYSATSDNQTLLQFSNFETVKIDISLTSFNNQIARTSMLHMKFSQKMRLMEAQFPYTNRFFPSSGIVAEPFTPYKTSPNNNPHNPFTD